MFVTWTHTCWLCSRQATSLPQDLSFHSHTYTIADTHTHTHPFSQKRHSWLGGKTGVNQLYTLWFSEGVSVHRQGQGLRWSIRGCGGWWEVRGVKEGGKKRLGGSTQFFLGKFLRGFKAQRGTQNNPHQTQRLSICSQHGVQMLHWFHFFWSSSKLSQSAKLWMLGFFIL